MHFHYLIGMLIGSCAHDDHLVYLDLNCLGAAGAHLHVLGRPQTNDLVNKKATWAQSKRLDRITSFPMPSLLGQTHIDHVLWHMYILGALGQVYENPDNPVIKCHQCCGWIVDGTP